MLVIMLVKSNQVLYLVGRLVEWCTYASMDCAPPLSRRYGVCEASCLARSTVSVLRGVSTELDLFMN